MSLEERIIELNADCDDKEKQIEAIELKKKLTKISKLLLILSILLGILSIGTFILFMVLVIKGKPIFILFSIIPLVFIIITFMLLLYSIVVKNHALDILIENENE